MQNIYAGILRFAVTFKSPVFVLLFSVNVTMMIFSPSGSLAVKMAPKSVSLREESELQAMLERLAHEQEDEEEGEGGDGEDPDS